MTNEYELDLDDTLVRYFSGRLPEAERAAFEAWIQANPAWAERLEALRAVWEASAEAPTGPDPEPALAQIKERISAARRAAAAERPILRLEPSLRRRASQARAWAVAAGVALLLGGGLLWRSAARHAPPTAAAPSVAARTYTTGRGERATLDLPDGSIVTLHNESTLEIPADFGGTTRDVRLSGEGYFEISHDPSHPFRVHSGRTVAQVLGTKFGVRARPEEDAVRVAVREGRVAVAAGPIGADAPVLGAGQVARLTASGDVTVRSGVDVNRLLSWTEGRLVFDRTPVPEVLAELSRWFDRDFVVRDSALARLRLTTVLGGQSLAAAIAVLETALDAHASVDGRTVSLSRP